MAESTTVTMGWDVGDKFTDVCVLGPGGVIVKQQQMRTTKQWNRQDGTTVSLA